MGLSILFFISAAFQPHGYCYQWNSGLVWLHVVSDSLIALAYFTIPFTLFWFMRKRRDLPFGWMFGLFGLFIVACGSTHVMEVWNLWHADYWLDGALKAVTAVASIGTAILLARLVPQAIALPAVEEWTASKKLLESEIQERRTLEVHLRLSEANYRETAALVDLTHDAIFVHNMRDEIIYWNRAAEALYGWKKDEVIGRTTHDLLRTVVPKPIGEIEAEIFNTGYWEGELIHHGKDGCPVIVSSRWAMSTKDGAPQTILESNRDISHRKEEEQKFESFLEAAPDAVVIADEQGNIVLVNSQTEKMFGYPRTELLGQKVEVLLPQKFRGKHHQHRAAFQERPKVRSIGTGLELHARRKDGTEFPVEISLSPLQTKSGALVSASVRDITERKHFEEALRQSDEQLRLLIQGVKDYAIVMLDPHGHITSWSDSAQGINGYLAEEIIGQHFSILHTEEGRLLHKPVEELKIAEEKGRFEEEAWRLRKDGSIFWASVVVTALRDLSGKLRGFGKVTRDFSLRKMAEEELTRQRGELAQKNSLLVIANRELEAFSYSVSHDLRGPLRTIDGFSHALLDDCGAQLNEKGKSHLKRIRSATQRMGALIDDLLSLSRFSRAPIHEQTVDMTALVSSVAAELHKSQPERRVQVAVGEGLAAVGDPGLLRVVIENLLGNAWKFTSKKCDAHIQFGQDTCNGATAFFLRDDGAGFDPAHADRLFGAFQRLHGTSEFEGTGIGLATVQRIIHRHSGRIWAEGAPGKGAAFYFTLHEPAAREEKLELQSNSVS
jgi:PAS domain S-box-containing protein